MDSSSRNITFLAGLLGMASVLGWQFNPVLFSWYTLNGCNLINMVSVHVILGGFNKAALTVDASFKSSVIDIDFGEKVIKHVFEDQDIIFLCTNSGMIVLVSSALIMISSIINSRSLSLIASLALLSICSFLSYIYLVEIQSMDLTFFCEELKNYLQNTTLREWIDSICSSSFFKSITASNIEANTSIRIGPGALLAYSASLLGLFARK